MPNKIPMTPVMMRLLNFIKKYYKKTNTVLHFKKWQMD